MITESDAQPRNVWYGDTYPKKTALYIFIAATFVILMGGSFLTVLVILPTHGEEFLKTAVDRHRLYFVAGFVAFVLFGFLVLFRSLRPRPARVALVGGNLMYWVGSKEVNCDLSQSQYRFGKYGKAGYVVAGTTLYIGTQEQELAIVGRDAEPPRDHGVLEPTRDVHDILLGQYVFSDLLAKVLPLASPTHPAGSEVKTATDASDGFSTDREDNTFRLETTAARRGALLWVVGIFGGLFVVPGLAIELKDHLGQPALVTVTVLSGLALVVVLLLLNRRRKRGFTLQIRSGEAAFVSLDNRVRFQEPIANLKLERIQWRTTAAAGTIFYIGPMIVIEPNHSGCRKIAVGTHDASLAWTEPQGVRAFPSVVLTSQQWRHLVHALGLSSHLESER